MLKWIGITLAALMALVLATAVIVSLLFDPNDYKDTLARWVEQRTGRELSIQGDLKLSLFPWLGVTTGGLALSNATGFDTDAFASVERVNARVKLLPLLARRFEIGSVELDGLILNLAIDAQGRGNWQDLMNPAATTDAVGATTGAGGASLDNIQVAGLRLSDATIYWRENVDQVRYILRDVSLTTGLLRPDEPVDLQLSMNLLSIEPQFNMQLQFNGAGLIDDAMDNFSAADVMVKFTLADSRDNPRASGSLATRLAGSLKKRKVTLSQGQLNAGLIDPPGGLPDDLTTVARWPMLEIDIANQTLDLAALTTTVNELTAQWTLRAERILDEPQVDGSVNATAVPWEQFIAVAALELPEGVNAGDLKSFDLSSPFTYQASAGLTLSDVRITTLGLQATAGATIRADGGITGRVAVPPFDAAQLIKAAGAALPAQVDTSAITRLAFTGSFGAQPAGGDISLPDFSAQLLGATLTGDLRISGGPGARTYSGRLKAPVFEGEAVAQAFASLLPENLDARELGPLGLDSRFRYAQDSDELRLDNLTLQSLGLQLTGTLAARSLSQSPTWTGRLATSPFSPRDLMTRFGQEVPRTADAKALSRATVVSDLVMNDKGGQFQSLRLNLDDTIIAGDFNVDDYDNPHYEFKLTIDNVNVDRYLPPQRTAAAKETREVTADQVKVPTETLNKLNLTGQVSVGQMRLAGLSFADVATAVRTGGGSARLESARAKLYGGTFDGSLSVDTGSRIPAINLKGSAMAIELEPLLVALRGESMVSGSGSFQLDLSGRGPTVLENVQSAAGSVEFALRDGAVKGFNLGHALCRAYNAQKKLPAPRDNVPNATAFALMKGSAQVTDGIAISRNIEATSSFLAVNGSGSLDLANQGLNYDLTAKLTGPIAIDGCDSMTGVVGQSIPLTLRGTISDPKIAPDFGKLLEQTIRRRVEEELKDKLLERLGLPRSSDDSGGDSGEQATPPR